MAAVRFVKVGIGSRGPIWQAEFLRTGGLPKGPQMTAREVTTVRPGIRGFVPRGTDRNAPRR